MQQAKYLLMLLFSLIITVSCSNNNEKIKSLETRVDSLQKKLENTYSAGFGELMTNIQIHHAKLWFAGKDKNWELSNYEIGEMRESFDDIQKYLKIRPESGMVPMIIPALDSVSTAIGKKDIVRFESAFRFLTNTCNACHQAAKHAFNVIVIPQTPPFTNQKFGLAK